MTDKDEVSFKTQEDVVHRALALHALLVRLSADSEYGDPHEDGPHWKQVFERLRAWIVAEAIDAHLTALEREVIAQPLGQIDKAVVDLLFGRGQGLAAILWALNKIDPMPSYDWGVCGSTLGLLLPFGAPIAEFVSTARLRSEDELVLERHRAEFWAWRASTEVFRHQGRPVLAGESYDDAIARGVQTAVEDGVAVEVRDGDVMCRGKRYCDVDDELIAFLAMMAQERCYALDWICGCVDEWDETPPET